MVHTRNATLPDVKQIHTIMQLYTGDGTLLPRNIGELCENIRDFVVAEDDGHIIGCGALHLYGTHLAEIRSIAVLPKAKGRGAGKAVVEALLQEAERHNVTCVCLFTRIPEFFAQIGFRQALREDLPDKMYKDCIHCPRFYACDEIAMVRGPIPEIVEHELVAMPVPLVRLST
jgi:amino-acid N-acetyltransferase